MKGQTGVGVWWAGGEGVERSRETEEARRGGRAVPVKPKPGSVNYEIGRVVYGRGPRCMQFLVSRYGPQSTYSYIILTPTLKHSLHFTYSMVIQIHNVNF